MIKLFFKTLALLFLPFFIQAQTPDLNSSVPVDPNVKIGKLPNGLTYYIKKNAKPEHRCELRLVVNAGSMMETDNQQGLAHLLEHMCFNGTQNFKKSELVDYLESIGTRFGADLNAYTSFDETVYMLQLPTDTEKIFLKGFQVLSDWAHLVLLESSEIDKERGVVIEEWRLGQGADERMRRKYFPVMFNGSRYADRLPIGTKEIIEGAPYDTIRSFYKSWYRPDLMAVVVVGDIDVNKIESLVKSYFAEIKNPTVEKQRIISTVPDHNDLKVSVCTDKEASYSFIQVYYKQPVPDSKTINDYRNSMISNLATSMLNDRYNELLQQNTPPFTFAGSDFSSLVRAKNAFAGYCVVPDGGIEKGLSTLLTEIKRVKDFGYTSTELDRAKQSVIRSYETMFNEKDKTESKSLVREYVSNFLEQEPIPGIEWEFNIAKELMPGITLDEVNKLISSWITDGKNCVIVVTAPEKEGISVPTDDAIKSIFKTVNGTTLTKYTDKVSDKPLTNTALVPGKVTKETTDAENGITSWTLSNGAKVVFKQTDFKNDQILFNAYSWGGTSLYSDADFISANNADGIIDNSGLGNYDNVELSKYVSNMVLSINPNIGELTEGLDGSCSVKDLENLLQFTNLYFTGVRKDSTAFNSVLSQMSTQLQNKNNDPGAVFSDSLTSIMYSYNSRYMPMTEKMMSQINLTKAYNIFRDRFSDPADFTFVFVGSINAETLKPLVEKYIGGIASKGKTETFKDNNVKWMSGNFNKKVVKGNEPKSTVAMLYLSPFEYTRYNRNELNAFMKLLNIKLRESLREDMSGVYGVSASPQMVHYPKSQCRMIIYFSCSPENVDTLIGAAKKVIAEIITNGCDDKNLLKVKELMLKEREAAMKENRFWLNLIVASLKDNEKVSEIKNYDTQISALKSDDFKRLAAKHFDDKNFGKVVLYPEK